MTTILSNLIRLFRIPPNEVPRGKRDLTHFLQGLWHLHAWYFGVPSDDSFEMYNVLDEDVSIIHDNASTRQKRKGFCDVFVVGVATEKDSATLPLMQLRGILCGILYKGLTFGVLYMNTMYVSDAHNFHLLMQILLMGQCWALNLGEVALKEVKICEQSSEGRQRTSNISQTKTLLQTIQDNRSKVAFIWIDEKSRDDLYSSIMSAVRTKRHDTTIIRRPWLYRGHSGLFWNRRAASVKKMAFNPSSMKLNKDHLIATGEPTPEDLPVIREIGIICSSVFLQGLVAFLRKERFYDFLPYS